MRVFVTGASGYIGNAVAQCFSNAGHHVTGLVRSEEKAQLLKKQEIIPLIGNISMPQTYLRAIKEAEVIVHCAFDNSSNGVKTEGTAISTILEGTRISGATSRTILYTSGVWITGNTCKAIADESSPQRPIEFVKWRVAIEDRLFQGADRHLKTVILRPGCVYGGRGGMTNPWFESAEKGQVEVVGNGNNHWAMVHYKDLAEAYVLAAEKELSGLVLNVTDDTHYTVKEMAEAAASVSGVPGDIHFLSENEAYGKYGHLAEGMLIDQHISNQRAKRLLGWKPRHQGFIDNINLYYESWKTCK